VQLITAPSFEVGMRFGKIETKVLSCQGPPGRNRIAKVISQTEVKDYQKRFRVRYS
jgi:hypothetical protein